jgi:hypothetical protein
VKSPNFPDVFTLAPPLLFKSGLSVIAPLSVRTVKSTDGESFSFLFPPKTVNNLILSHEFQEPIDFLTRTQVVLEKKTSPSIDNNYLFDKKKGKLFFTVFF